MARSALMQLVQRIAARTRPLPDSPAAAQAVETRKKLAAARARAREQRRELLKRGAALAGVASVAPWSVAAAPASARNASNVVIGAGLAGLTAAWELSRRGVLANVFEAAPRVGGRCWTERSVFDEGQIAERGGELIDTAHDEIIDLALALGLSLDDLHAATPRAGESVHFIDGIRYTEAQAATDFAKLWPALARDAQRLGSDLPTFARHTPQQAALDRMTAREWLQTRVPGAPASRLARLLANAYVEELGAELDEISAVTVIDLLRDSPRDRVSPYEESDQRYRVRGGNDRIVQELARALGPRIETSTRLVALARRGDGRYRLTLASDGAQRDVDADHVVLAVPFTLLREVDLSGAGFRARKLTAIRELGMGRNTKLQLQFRHREWIGRGGNGETRLEGSYHVSWEVSRAQPGASGILNFYSGGDGATRAAAGTPEERARDALTDLERIYPGIGASFNGRVIRNPWERHPWSRGSYSLLKPGQYVALHGIEHVAEHRVHFAGEQSSPDWYGYLNGAVDSGLRAAGAIASVPGQRRAA